MSAYRIRVGRSPADDAIARRFIMGLQEFEKTVEPDRRIDARVAEEFWPVLAKRVAEREGRIFIAEANGAAIGWAVGFVDENEIYVEPAVRSFGYVSELFVVEEWRGKGVGRALIAECEGYFRSLKLPLMMIGVLAGNTNARKSYVAVGFRPYSEMLQKTL